MSIWLSVILCALLGYLLGCINPAYLIARARGFDIRSRGSGTAGAWCIQCRHNNGQGGRSFLRNH